jgi:hypothetical protein
VVLVPEEDGLMIITRYLSFEINRDCDLAAAHWGRCPNSHPHRYINSKSTEPLTDKMVIGFYRWCKEKHNFRGIVNWNGYNEPSLAWEHISDLMRQMRMIDPVQPFQIVTNNLTMDFPGVDIVTRSYYAQEPLPLDNRVQAIYGEGLPYEQAYSWGQCARGQGWEIVIDYYGNWLLCCNDWRNEESFGCIYDSDLELLFKAWKAKGSTIKWWDKDTWDGLPRMCRSCISTNPKLFMPTWM